MKVGFTGTRLGCTEAQKKTLRALLNTLHVTEFHHGDCIGADAQAHAMVIGKAVIYVHPSNNPTQRAYCAGYHTEKPLPPLVRNKVIVDRVDRMIACPKGPEEVRSGTWATVRYTRRQGKMVTTVWPDGRVEHEEIRNYGRP